jgi:SAM-dependent methyltransferase
MPAENPYDEIAAYYDLEHRSFTDDIDLYLQFIEAAGDPVLELGCGTGRIVRAIAEAGFDVTGVDASPSMLQVARDAMLAESFEGEIAFIESDFALIDLVDPGTFGVAIVALDSLLHAETQSDQLRVLRAALTALDPRGQLVVDVLNPTPARLLAMDGDLTFSGSWTMDDGARLDKLVAQQADPAAQVISNEIWYEVTTVDGAVKRTRTAFPQRWISAAELILMLQLAGFQDWRIYGSYELDELGPNSDRIIVAAEKTKTD